MPHELWFGLAAFNVWVYLTFGYHRALRLKWISVPWAITALSVILTYLVLPRFHREGEWTVERIVAVVGIVSWIVGLVSAVRLRNRCNTLIKRIEADLAALDSEEEQPPVDIRGLEERLHGLVRLIAPTGVAPESDISSEWIAARLRGIAAERQLPQAGNR